MTLRGRMINSAGSVRADAGVRSAEAGGGSDIRVRDPRRCCRPPAAAAGSAAAGEPAPHAAAGLAVPLRAMVV
eukprot:3042789-Pyramimonas_sp.AAC.1